MDRSSSQPYNHNEHNAYTTMKLLLGQGGKIGSVVYSMTSDGRDDEELV